MIIQLFDFNFPSYSVSFCVMFQCDWEVAALVELAKGSGAALALLEGTCLRWPDNRCVAHVRLGIEILFQELRLSINRIR